MDNLFVRIHDWLSAGTDVVLARIVRRYGSGPRKPGSAVVVLPDGSFEGSVGGGDLEKATLKAADGVRRSGRSRMLIHRSGDGSDRCGGSTDVYLEWISTEDENARAVFAAAARLVRGGSAGTLFTRLAVSPGEDAATPRWLVPAAGEPVGCLPGDKILADKEPPPGPPRRIDSVQGPPVFVHPVGGGDTLLLLGAGHVAACLAPLARGVGFRVVVFDGREDMATHDRFPDADEVQVLSPDRALEKVVVDGSSYLAVMTHSHELDGRVLEAALRTRPAYLGMMAGSRKRRTLFDRLLAAGVSEGRLASVQSPIGLSIQAETPEEIAVSIVAQLIRVRAGRRMETE